MGKTRRRSRSELEYLRGRIRQLESELKYYKRRSHIQEDIIDGAMEEIPVQDISVKNRCPNCSRGVLVEYDFIFATLKKCSENCGYEEKRRKRKTDNETLADE